VPSEPTIRVPADFEAEFPGASRSASEVAANLSRTATALVSAVERWPRETANLSASAFQTLAILEGASEPLPAHVIAERLIVRSASMTSLLDTLERRGLVERHPHPSDRRKILVHLPDTASPARGDKSSSRGRQRSGPGAAHHGTGNDLGPARVHGRATSSGTGSTPKTSRTDRAQAGPVHEIAAAGTPGVGHWSGPLAKA
jgi:DNA-binding MarR family transcriptional regulator